MDAEALKYYSILVEKFPDYLASYYQLGKLYERIQQMPKAKDSYKKGIQVAQDAKDLKTLRELNEALALLQDE
jgi:tetratricopeptide (TPR) repeat protein